MPTSLQEFKLKKINDHGWSQKRTLQLRENSLAAMKGKKVTREIEYRYIDGITFNVGAKKAEFIIHNTTGDLRYRCKNDAQRKIILMHLLDHARETHNLKLKDKFYWVRLEDLKSYHNTKHDYEDNHTIRMPKEYECDPDYMENNAYLWGVASHLSKERLDTIKSQLWRKSSQSSEDFKYVGDSEEDEEEEEDYRKLLTLQKGKVSRPLEDIFEESGGERNAKISMDIPTLERDSQYRTSAFNKFTSG